MLALNNNAVIAQTKKWIIDVVIGCSFCPFAAKEMKRGSIHYEVLESASPKIILETTIKMFQQLDADDTIETSLLILPNDFKIFSAYLDIVEKAERLLEKEN